MNNVTIVMDDTHKCSKRVLTLNKKTIPDLEIVFKDQFGKLMPLINLDTTVFIIKVFGCYSIRNNPIMTANYLRVSPPLLSPAAPPHHHHPSQ